MSQKHRTRIRISSTFGIVAVLALLAACGGPAEEDAGQPLVVATTGMIADMADRIGGAHVRVEALMGPGTDPHLYKPSEGDVRNLARADLILYNGLHLEGKMASILEKMSRTRPVVAVADAVPEDQRLVPVGAVGQVDPHVWFDPVLWSSVLEPIEVALAGILPDRADEFRRNRDRLEAELADLHLWVEGRIAEIPVESRVLVTAHDAFGYFGRRYGVEVVGLQGISTVAEAGLQDVERLVELIVDRRIGAIFVEASVSRRSIESVQAACRDRGHEVDIGGQLFSDSMGGAGTPEGTYIGMVRHNVDTMVEALR
jgi:manganese/zinc/iron transport system substrate-binding protein